MSYISKPAPGGVQQQNAGKDTISSAKNSLPYFPSPASDDDRAWFIRHPKRQYRLRAAYPEEIPDNVPRPPAGWRICVHQLRPGIRFRAPVVALFLAREDASEAEARAVFQSLTNDGEMQRVIAEVVRHLK